MVLNLGFGHKNTHRPSKLKMEPEKGYCAFPILCLSIGREGTAPRPLFPSSYCPFFLFPFMEQTVSITRTRLSGLPSVCSPGDYLRVTTCVGDLWTSKMTTTGTRPCRPTYRTRVSVTKDLPSVCRRPSNYVWYSLHDLCSSSG